MAKCESTSKPREAKTRKEHKPANNPQAPTGDKTLLAVDALPGIANAAAVLAGGYRAALAARDAGRNAVHEQRRAMAKPRFACFKGPEAQADLKALLHMARQYNHDAEVLRVLNRELLRAVTVHLPKLYPDLRELTRMEIADLDAAEKEWRTIEAAASAAIHAQAVGCAAATSDWSKPMSKAKMMAALRIDSTKTFDAFAKKQGIQEAGNRQTWRLKMDGLSEDDQARLRGK